MSRGPFRARVAEPRPTSAWVLVGVASATLWITQQLDTWALAAQASAILFSLWRRTRPLAWQKSPITLNVGMFGIVTGTIAVALRGEPSTIALAHFAALTQGLQLIDARPRHTEFLLVTLALFQVILASNLTDSVFFPPLLVGFVFAAVWTLMVHTLRTEAIEAGDPRAVNRAITPGLLRMTLLASGLSVLLALVLFVSLPRLRTSVVRGPGMGHALATVGFSDSVALGEIGRIRQDATVVMRIETLEGTEEPPGAGYWRGLAFDRFDGTSWSITPSQRERVAGSAEGGVSLGRRPDDVDLVQRIVREPVAAGVLFRAGEPGRVHGTVRHLERDSSGGLYAAGQADERIRYTVATQRRRWGDAALRRDRAEPDPRHPQRDLQLPELAPVTRELAEAITLELETDAERVRAVESYLLKNGRYTNVPPRADPEGELSPVETFLTGGMAGHCEYFASSMVLLLRSLGIPARLVNGFAGGERNAIGGFLEVTSSDAHTWVEVRYARAGWVPYDPTPSDLRARPAAALSLSERVRQLASAAELWWFQRVVGFDRADQVQALKRAWLAWRGAHEGTPQRPRDARAWADWGETPRELRLWLAVLALAALGLFWHWRGGGRAHALPAAYARALRLLARRGLARGSATTARAFAAEVRHHQPAPVARAFDALTEAYLAERFGGHPAAQAGHHLTALQTALKQR